MSIAKGPFERTHTVLARPLINSNYFQSEASKIIAHRFSGGLKLHVFIIYTTVTKLDIDL